MGFKSIYQMLEFLSMDVNEETTNITDKSVTDGESRVVTQQPKKVRSVIKEAATAGFCS